MRLLFHIFLAIAALCPILPGQLKAQDSTHVITAKEIKQKKNFPLLAGGSLSVAPHFSSEMGPGAAFSYTGKTPVSAIGNITAKGYLLLGLAAKGETRDNKWKYSGSIFYNYTPSYFWGLGYRQAENSSAKTKYHQKKFRIQGEIAYRFTPKFSAGPSIGYEWVKWEDFLNSSVRSSLLDYGFFAEYEGRDHITNPSGGFHAVLRQRNWSNLSGSASLQYSGYGKVWDGGILALDLYTIFTYGDIPVTMLPSVGGTERMRGYHYGRYRDNNVATAQIELRQHIWNMIGGAVWAGCANLWGDYSKFRWGNTLPNFGIGTRIHLTDNICLRLDYGVGKRWQDAFILSINEAF